MAKGIGAYKVYRNRKQVHERKMANAVGRVLDRTVDQFISRLSAGGSPVSSLPDGAKLGRELIQALAPSAVVASNAATLYALRDVEAAYGRPLPVINQKKQAPVSERVPLSKAVSEQDVKDLGLNTTVANVFKPEALGKIKTIGPEYIGALRNQIKQSMEANEGRPALINRIKQFKGQNAFRAKRIAQTESTRLFNESSMDAYSKSTVVKSKQWITNMSSGRSRDAHITAHLQAVAVDKPFLVMGEQLMYPGDPVGSAANVVYCQCALMPVVGKVKPGSLPKQPKPKVPGVSGWKEVTTLEDARDGLKQFGDWAGKIYDSNYTDPKAFISVVNELGRETAVILKELPDLKDILSSMKTIRFEVQDARLVRNIRGLGDAAGVMGGYNELTRNLAIAGRIAKNAAEVVRTGGFAVGKSFNAVYRHELGHALNIPVSTMARKAGEVAWGELYRSESAAYWAKKVSKYGAANSSECFAESFVLWSSPQYKVGMLPKQVENWFNKVLPRAVETKR